VISIGIWIIGAMIYLPLRARQGGRRGRREEGAFKTVAEW
jgi:hypothetical protein